MEASPFWNDLFMFPWSFSPLTIASHISVLFFFFHFFSSSLFSIVYSGLRLIQTIIWHLLLLFRYEFKTIYEEWVKSAKPRLGYNVFERVLEAINTTQDNIKILYKVRNEMRAALQRLLKVSLSLNVSLRICWYCLSIW